MKIKQLLLISTMCLSIAPTLAYTTADELTSTEQMVNYNFSKTTADHVQLVKAQNANREYRSERMVNLPWYKKVRYYIDPTYDNEVLLQHSIEPISSWKDY